MIDERFLGLMRCPIDGSELANADPGLLQKLNQLIEAGELRDRMDQRIEDPLDEALVTVDQKHIYPVRAGIPSLIGDEAIAYPAANRS